MKRVWTEVEPTDGKKRPNVAIVGVQKGSGGEDGVRNGFQEVAKTVQDGAKMGQDAAKTRENESKVQKGAGGEDGLQNGFQVVAKMRPRRSKMGPRCGQDTRK